MITTANDSVTAIVKDGLLEIHGLECPRCEEEAVFLQVGIQQVCVVCGFSREV